MANTSDGYYYATTGTSTPADPAAVSAAEATAAQAVYDDSIFPGLTPRAASSVARDTIYPSPVQGDQVRRTDLGLVEMYFEEYNSVSNPGGAVPAGWYTISIGQWIDFTPTFASGSIGAGTVEYAKFAVMGPVVEVRFKLVLGSGFSMTDLVVDVPYGAITFGDFLQPIGDALLFDTSAGGSGRYRGFAYPTSSGTVRIATIGSSDGITAVTTSTTPFSWASNDEIHARFSYPIA